MLRSHLLSHGFAVDDGPPVAVGAAGGVFRTTRFHGAAPAPETPSAQAAAPKVSAVVPPSPKKAMDVAPEPLPFELPILRNFRPSQPALETTGVDADLSGIDFLLDHGLLDEARMRVEQMAREHPGHPGVEERLARLDAAAGPRTGLSLSLTLDDDWGVPTLPPAAPVAAAQGATTTAARARTSEATDATPAQSDVVVCSVFCALAVDEGDTFEIRAWLHLTSETEAHGVAIVDDRREAAVLSSPVTRGESLTLSLSLPGLQIEGFPAVPIAWNGSATSAMFKVSAPPGTADSQAEGWLTIGRKGEPIGDVPLRIRIA